MSFDMQPFFESIFKPTRHETLSIMFDVPHDEITDNPSWQERRSMAVEWWDKISGLAPKSRMKVNPMITYNATGGDNADLPPLCRINKHEVPIKKILETTTILISMPEFSATAPLYFYTLKLKSLRVASMPGVAKFMEESGLSADYLKISAKAKTIVNVFKEAIAAEVLFSTGHTCYFDLPVHKPVLIDDGILHPDRAGTENALSNLPAGEVLCVPNEDKSSRTCGDLPHLIANELAVYKVKENRIVSVSGNSPEIARIRRNIFQDRGWQNIAEFAIGINDKARVTGNVLEDEKAGFHWAYGRSDHFGGKFGVKDFISPENVVHHDIVYAKGNEIFCRKLDMIFPNQSRQTVIHEGSLLI